MQQFRREATKYHVSDVIDYQRRKTNEPPAKVLVCAEQKRKAMDAANELSGLCGREGTLRKIVELYWSSEMYVNIKDWVKMCEQC